MERCPACRARLNNAVACKRCDCDLTLVFAARNQADKALQQALQAISQDQSEQAFQQASQALQLDATPLAILVNKYLQLYPPPAQQTSPTIVDTISSRVSQSLKYVRHNLLKHHH